MFNKMVSGQIFGEKWEKNKEWQSYFTMSTNFILTVSVPNLLHIPFGSCVLKCLGTPDLGDLGWANFKALSLSLMGNQNCQ